MPRDEDLMNKLIQKAFDVKEPFTAMVVEETTGEIIAEGYAHVGQI